MVVTDTSNEHQFIEQRNAAFSDACKIVKQHLERVACAYSSVRIKIGVDGKVEVDPRGVSLVTSSSGSRASNEHLEKLVKEVSSCFETLRGRPSKDLVYILKPQRRHNQSRRSRCGR